MDQHIQRQRKSAERIHGEFGWLKACTGRYKVLPTNYADNQQKHFQDSLKDKFEILGYYCRYFICCFLNQIQSQPEPLCKCELWTTMCCVAQNITWPSILSSSLWSLSISQSWLFVTRSWPWTRMGLSSWSRSTSTLAAPSMPAAHTGTTFLSRSFSLLLLQFCERLMSAAFPFLPIPFEEVKIFLPHPFSLDKNGM